MRIGLFGGSFNPPHAGHVHVSRLALQRLKLDQVWWLVSPGNPLKENGHLRPLPERMAQARALIRDPRIVPTAIEADLGTRYTIDTLRALRRRAPHLRFVWIMGADNLMQFDRWKGWREIAALVPFAVIDRPDATLGSTAAPAARALAPFRLPERVAATLSLRRPPAWVLLHGPRSTLSSSAVRANARTA
jgi:nicotinate-nucleotide adenylyltransferase